jgi:hypothetical protein
MTSSRLAKARKKAKAEIKARREKRQALVRKLAEEAKV